MSILVSRESGIATVTLNRPDKLNALSGAMYHELADAFGALGGDDVVISHAADIAAGAERASGADHDH